MPRATAALRHAIHVVFLMLIGLASPIPVDAQTTSPPLVSPQVHPDRTVTFRHHAPGADEVRMSGDWPGGRHRPLTKADNDIWTRTIGPLNPGQYTYHFVVDGMKVLDRANSSVKPAISASSSMLVVPSDEPVFHHFRHDSPHGALRVVHFHSEQLGEVRRMHVYTPPDYDASDRDYPVLYLLHGYTSNDAAWSARDHAHWIADNLIAAGKIEPLIIVMPLNHVKPMPPRRGDPDYVNTNKRPCDQHLIHEVVPYVDRHFRTVEDRHGRAIAGLSMGADQASYTALSPPDRFAWAAPFAPGARERDNPDGPVIERFIDSGAPPFELFWLTCGREDGFLDNCKRLSERLSEAGIDHEFEIVDGGHTHAVFRKNLRDFLLKIDWKRPAPDRTSGLAAPSCAQTDVQR